ncbi:MAG: glycosyltransferase, partial [Planctomycetales bacterium]
MPKPRVALVVSHPIQHFCPQYASLARSDEYVFKVFFASTIGFVAYEDPNFKTTVQWGNLRLDAFEHEFMNTEPLPSTRHLDAPNIGQALEEFSPDVVIIYGYWQQFQKRVQDWVRSNQRLVYYIADSESHRHESFLKRTFTSLRLRRRFQAIDRFLTVGNANEFYYHRLGVPTYKMTRMQFSIDVDQFETAYQNRDAIRSELRQSMGVDHDCTVVATVGKLVPWKRQKDAILAMSRLDPSVNAKLLVLGSGPDEAELKALADELIPGRVHFAGFVVPSELPKHYLGSDVYLHCSDYEPHSLAISEAIYMGLPLLLSHRCGSYGPTDDLQPGRNGFVYRTRDVDMLASMMSTMALNPDLTKVFSEASREYALAAQSRAHEQFLT